MGVLAPMQYKETKMRENVKYVKDAHGHVYIYVEVHHAERIGRGLEFTEQLQHESQLAVQRQRSYRTLQELREAAAKVGFDIPDGTPFASAQNQYAKFLKSSNDLSGIGAFDNAGKTTN